MDLAIYISELLGLEGEVNLPGIGHFAQVRVNGYYSEPDNKFYPPTHRVSFLPQENQDDRLARYIAGKKNISLASAKYFIEKYAAGLRSQLVLGRAEITGLGNLYDDGAAMKFSGGSAAETSDPAFYGFAPISVETQAALPRVPPVAPPAIVIEEVKPDVRPAEPSPEHRIATPVGDRSTAQPEPTEETLVPQQEEYGYTQPERHQKPLVIWLLIITIILLAVLGLYKYKPDWFIFSGDKPQTYVAVNSDTTKPAAADSLKTAIKPDTALKTQAAAQGATIKAAVDTFAVVRYEILGGAFESSEQADAVMKNYQKRGLQPRIIQHTSSRHHIITLGTYFDQQRAQKAYDSIAVATNLKKGSDIILQTYNPKK